MSQQHYYIYAIECFPTGRKYIGQTGKSNPFLRWSEHISDLKNGTSKCPKMQSEWNLHPDMIHWTFRVINHAFGKCDANHKEAGKILDVPQDQRLNCATTSTVSYERRLQVEEMLRSGVKYIDIRDTVGLSTGMISKIKKQMQSPSAFY